jgi:predicted nucleic acid-binding protein
MMRPAPEARVDRWLSGQPTDEVFITAITEAELRYGAALLPSGRRQKALANAIEATLAQDYRERILPFDSLAAVAFAQIMTFRRRAGRPMLWADGQIAAIARSRTAIFATRNVSDFADCGVEVVNPWDTGAG